MKILNGTIGFVTFLAMITFSTGSGARDKIGNGGGVWVCGESDRSIQELTFVDFFEATQEMGWSLKDFKTMKHQDITEVISEDVLRDFPGYAAVWKKSLEQVLKNLVFLDVELEIIDDALSRARPLAATCSAGPWRYGQLANFNEFGNVSVRRDFWNHPTFTEIEKAGLIWHEALYLWLREAYADENSVRARYITGLIFSTEPIAIKVELLRKVLDRSPPPPTQGKAFCMVKNAITHQWHSGYGPSARIAEMEALKNCQNGEAGFHCEEHNVKCDALKPSASNVCSIENTLTHKDFYAEGRSEFEAKYKAHKVCENDEPRKVFHCAEETWRCEAN